jgi:spore maturation protein CgeB
MNRPLRVLLVHPGATWSTADVFDGLKYGLEYHGVHVVPYRLDTRITLSHRVLWAHWRHLKKKDPEIPKPNRADVSYHAGADALMMGLREHVDVVIIVSAMLMHPDLIVCMKRAGLRVVCLFTESPYDVEHEAKVAGLVDGGWTNERFVLPELKAVNPHMGYLKHGWHPLKHTPDASLDDVPSHDVVFVGSGFPERIEFFNRINWDGIDLGLYGTWGTERGVSYGLEKKLYKHVKAHVIENRLASALYRKAKIGLNLYRNRNSRRIKVHAESLSPRAYELAACGAFHLSEYRPEVQETFGDLVPTFQTPKEAEALIRQWLADDAGRQRISGQLPAIVVEASWIQRAATVLGDLGHLLQQQAA